MFEDQDREILKKLKTKKKSFSQVLNRKNLDELELEKAMQEDF